MAEFIQLKCWLLKEFFLIKTQQAMSGTSPATNKLMLTYLTTRIKVIA